MELPSRTEFVRRTERETEQESRRHQEGNGVFPHFFDACRKCADSCLRGGKCTKFGRKHPPGRGDRRIHHRRSTGRNRFFFIRRHAGGNRFIFFCRRTGGKKRLSFRRRRGIFFGDKKREDRRYGRHGNDGGEKDRRTKTRQRKRTAFQRARSRRASPESVPLPHPLKRALSRAGPR